MYLRQWYKVCVTWMRPMSGSDVLGTVVQFM